MKFKILSDSTCDLPKEIIEQNNITIEADLSQDSPILILEDDLYQIAFNLVENGIKYNVPGGKLTVRLFRQDDNAILQVTDTGTGIPDDAESAHQ